MLLHGRSPFDCTSSAFLIGSISHPAEDTGLLILSGHRSFNHLQPPKTSILFHSVPKTKSARRTLSQRFGTRRTVLRWLQSHPHEGNGCGMRAAIYVRCSTTSKKKFGDASAYLATVVSITYNHPKPQFCSILFQKQNRLAELCLNVLERDGLFCDGFKVIRTREMGAACELQFTFDAQRQARRRLVMLQCISKTLKRKWSRWSACWIAAAGNSIKSTPTA